MSGTGTNPHIPVNGRIIKDLFEPLIRHEVLENVRNVESVSLLTDFMEDVFILLIRRRRNGVIQRLQYPILTGTDLEEIGSISGVVEVCIARVRAIVIRLNTNPFTELRRKAVFRLLRHERLSSSSRFRRDRWRDVYSELFA